MAPPTPLSLKRKNGNFLRVGSLLFACLQYQRSVTSGGLIFNTRALSELYMRLVTFFLMIAFSFALGCGNDDATNADNSGSEQNETTDDDPSDSLDDVTEPGPVIWTGPKIVFEKENFADPADAASQDAITERVVLTRGSRNSLYNVVLEASGGNDSPMGTGWAEGTTADLEGLVFQPLKPAAGDQLKRLPGKSFVLHLVEEDIYLDVTFLTWTSGGDSGGGFSYERSTPSE